MKNIKQTLWWKYFAIRSRYMRYKLPRLYKSNLRKAVEYVYWMAFCCYPNLNNPKSINEKLQVLKLKDYYNNPVITQCVDKLRVKDYLKERGYGELCAPTYGSFDNPDEINWDILPEQFVIKCNHGCGYNILVEDKSKLDIQNISETLRKWMAEDTWKLFAEYQYIFVEKKILIEQYLGERINTYKFYCFHGEPKVVYVSQADENGVPDRYLDYYDMDWNHLNIHLGAHPWNPIIQEKPKNFESMFNISRRLSADFPFVRVDLYSIDEQVYFSEFTFMPTGGYMQLQPKEITLEWGEWLHLEQTH